MKEKVGLENIDRIEKYYLKRFYNKFINDNRVIFYGPTDPDKKIGIIPFNIKHKNRILHPKFITKLMNDLFGIQTRAGCSCAGPYGHRLLQISEEISKYYQCLIGVDKYAGIKPGWVRFNLHYAHSLAEFDYIVNVLDFILEHAHKFLPFYEFDFQTGDWHHSENQENCCPINLDFDKAINAARFVQSQPDNCENIYKNCLDQAYKLVSDLQTPENFAVFESKLEELMFFYVIKYINRHE